MYGYKKLLFILVLITFVSLPTLTFAQSSAGIKPGNFLYFLDTTLERVELFLTFDSGKKAEKALEYAEERLAEVRDIARENKPIEVIQKVVVGYEKQIAFATEKSKNLIDIAKSDELLETIFRNTEKHLDVLEGVLEETSEEARSAIENAIEVSKKGHDEVTRQIEEFKIKADERQLIVDEFKSKLERPKEEVKVIEAEIKDTESKRIEIRFPNIKSILPERKVDTVDVKKDVLIETPKVSFPTKPAVKPVEKVETLPSAVVHAPSPEIKFSALENPDQSAVLAWSSSGASKCTGTNFETGDKVEGKVTVKVAGKTDYKVTCFNKEGSSTVRTISLPLVAGAPIIDFRSWSDFSGGKTTKLTWKAESATFCDGNGFNTGGELAGTVKVTQEETTVYSLTCTGPKGSNTVNVVAVVIPTEEAPGGPALSLDIVDKEVILKWSAPIVGCSITGTDGFSFITDEKEGKINTGKAKDNTSYRIFCEEVIKN